MSHPVASAPLPMVIAGMQIRLPVDGSAVSRSSTPLMMEELARDAARQAITKLLARPAPSGSMPSDQERFRCVLFHEACGHGLEADLVAKESSLRGQGRSTSSPTRSSRLVDGTMVRVRHK
jgi:hypothetical protein